MSLVQFIIHDAEGRIVGSGGCVSTDLVLQGSEEGQTVIEITGENYSDTSHYVSGADIMNKTDLTADWNKSVISADGIDEAILSPLPIPCTVFVDGDPTLVNDGSYEFSADDPGVYRIRVDTIQYLEQTWEIVANEV